MKSFKWSDFAKGLAVTFLIWGSYFVFIFPKTLFRDKDGISSLGIVWGDWAAHFAYAAPFAFRPMSQWFLSHPAFIERKFTYPFLLDAFSGLLIRFGVDEVVAFWAPSLLLVLGMIFLIYKLAFVYFSSGKKAFLAVTLFLTNGSFWFFLNKSGLPNEQMRILNFVVSEILPQRGMVLGLVMVLSVWLAWTKWQKNNFENVSWGKIFFWGLLAGILPLVHMHSFIVLFLSGVVFLCFDFKNWEKWIFFATVTALPALLIWKFFYQGQIQDNFFIWQPGWLVHGKSILDWLEFWFLSWGLFLPLVFFSARKIDFHRKPLFWTGVLLFILSNLILFQPWDWDNVKILTFVYLIFSLPVASFLVDLWEKKKIIFKLLAFLIFSSLIFSGGSDLYNLTRKDVQTGLLWTNDELFLAEKFRKISEPGDIVLTSDKHCHFIPTHTGARILMGYRGWLWSYGMKYEIIEKDILTMYQGGDLAQKLFRKYQIKYVVIGNSEKNDFLANEKFFLDNYPLVLRSKEYKIFEMQ